MGGYEVRFTACSPVTAPKPGVSWRMFPRVPASPRLPAARSHMSGPLTGVVTGKEGEEFGRTSEVTARAVVQDPVGDRVPG